MAITATQMTLVAQAETSVTICAHPVGGLFEDTATYQWYRSTTQGFTPGGGNILSGKTSRTIVDTGLTSNTIYYYVLRATSGMDTVDYPEFDVLTLGAAVGLPLKDAVSGANGVNNTLAGTVTWNHTCSGTNRGLFVMMHAVRDSAWPAVVTYGGVPLMPLGQASHSGGFYNVLFKLVNPPLGEHAIVANWNHVEGSYQPTFAAISVKDWDTIGQHGTLEISPPGSAGDPVSITVDYNTGDLVLGFAASGGTLTDGSGLQREKEQLGVSGGTPSTIVSATQAGLSWTGTSGGGWAVMGLSLKPVGTGGVRPLACIERFEARMIAGATGQAAAATAAKADFDLNGNPNSATVQAVAAELGDYSQYYAGPRVLKDIGDYLGVTTYDQGVTDMLYAWRKGYLEPEGYDSVPAYRVFSDAAVADYELTSDSHDLVIVEEFRDSTSYSGDGATALEGTAYSRENTYHLMTHQKGDLLGLTPRTTKHNELIANAKSHMEKWVVDFTWVGVDEQVSPFVFGLTGEALIRHYAATSDSEVLPLITAACDYLWEEAWLWGQLGMRYHLNDAGTDDRGPKSLYGSPVLNNLIAKMYAWLAVQTGDQAQMDRADWLFAGSAIAEAYVYGKQFNQAHWFTLGPNGTLAMREQFFNPSPVVIKRSGRLFRRS